MLIARLLAASAQLGHALDAAREDWAARDMPLAMAEPVHSGENAIELMFGHGEVETVREVLDAHFPAHDALVADAPFQMPQLFISDMDSTIIGQECIDELADFAGLKDKVADITERAMRGELDFAAALRERVGLLKGLSAQAIRDCLDQRIRPMSGAATLLATLKDRGCHTVLVTGGFHQFADPVAEMLGFDQVVANRLEIVDGALTGGLVGGIVDSAVKRQTLLAEAARLGSAPVTLATGDGANDIPMLEAATYGMAYHAKPKARAAANGWIGRGDLTAVLELLGIAREQWVRG